jgi:hypothetical protein
VGLPGQDHLLMVALLEAQVVLAALVVLVRGLDRIRVVVVAAADLIQATHYLMAALAVSVPHIRLR